MRITKHGRRFWAVYDQTEALVCICVYKKGAVEVVRRIGNESAAPIPEMAALRPARRTPTRPAVYDPCRECTEEKPRETL